MTHRTTRMGRLAWIQTIAILVLVASVLALMGLVDHLYRTRAHERQIANESTVQRCFGSAANTPALARVLRALATDPDLSPQSREDLINFSRVSLENASTFKECRQLADQLGVSVPKEVR